MHCICICICYIIFPWNFNTPLINTKCNTLQLAWKTFFPWLDPMVMHRFYYETMSLSAASEVILFLEGRLAMWYSSGKFILRLKDMREWRFWECKVSQWIHVDICCSLDKYIEEVEMRVRLVRRGERKDAYMLWGGYTSLWLVFLPSFSVVLWKTYDHT